MQQIPGKGEKCNFFAHRFRKWENSLGTNIEHMQSRCMAGGAKNPSFLAIFCSSACARLLVHFRCPLRFGPLAQTSKTVSALNRASGRTSIDHFYARLASGGSESSFRPSTEKKKADTTTTERKSFGELFWPQGKTFQAGGGYKNPIKTKKAISTTEIFPLWTPFLSEKKVLHRSRAVYAFGVCFLFPSSKCNRKIVAFELRNFPTRNGGRRNPASGGTQKTPP